MNESNLIYPADYIDKIIVGDCIDVMPQMPDGCVDLIYIDPPFGFDGDKVFGMPKWSTLDYPANRIDEILPIIPYDIGIRNYLRWMYDRLVQMHRVLAEDGSIYVHCDWRVNSYLRLILDDILGRDGFQREIVWRIGWLSGYKTKAKNWIRNHDTILFYSKDKNNFIFNKEYIPYAEDYMRRDGKKPTGPGYPIEDTWNCNEIDKLDSIQIMSFSSEKTGYDTQKNENLLERIIKASSNKGDIVADFFCGSGTTGVVAERLGRKWIMVDISQKACAIAEQRIKVELSQPDLPLMGGGK